MIKVLRSVMWVNPLEKDRATVNLGKVDERRLVYMKPMEKGVLHRALAFYTKYAQAPELKTINDECEKEKVTEEVVLMEDIVGESFYGEADFIHLYEDEIERQSQDRIVEVCKTASKIAKVGDRINKDYYKGADAAFKYIVDEVRGKPSELDGRLPMAMREADEAIEKLYQERKTSPYGQLGVGTGYAIIDESTMGLKKKQLYIHAGYGGHLKSTCMLNMMLNAAVDGGWNGIFFSSEMPAEEVMLLLLSMHSANPKYRGRVPLNARSLMMGTLDEDGESLLKDVKQDLLGNKDYGSIRVVDSGDFSTLSTIVQKVRREHAIEEIDMVWIDYVTRLPVDIKYSRMENTQAKNETIADAKRLAMEFDEGEGIVVATAFQVNREGFKRARDNQGKLDNTCLAQYNAAEREADVISYVYYGEEEARVMEPKMGVMKSRYGPVPLDPVPMYVDPDSRRITDLSKGMASDGQGVIGEPKFEGGIEI